MASQRHAAHSWARHRATFSPAFFYYTEEIVINLALITTMCTFFPVKHSKTSCEFRGLQSDRETCDFSHCTAPSSKGLRWEPWRHWTALFISSGTEGKMPAALPPLPVHHFQEQCTCSKSELWRLAVLWSSNFGLIEIKIHHFLLTVNIQESPSQNQSP